MFKNCFCSPKQKEIPKTCKYYQFISKRCTLDVIIVNEREYSVLKLIYQDLASRNSQKLLSYQNFLDFFDLTGLWGAKLFQEFDEDQTQFISIEQFLYGISKTIKAPYSQKIQLLYSFFQEDKEPGIKFKQFMKMLYNYSREQLKQILVDDGLLNKPLIQLVSTSIFNLTKPVNKILNINCSQLELEKKNSFQRAYKEAIDQCISSQPGTCLEIQTNNLTYTVRYSNMNSLVKQFTGKIYQENKIDKLSGYLTFQQFKKWIDSHQKLFLSYFSMFHWEIWGFIDGKPQYLDGKIQKQFLGKMSQKREIRQVYAMLVGDALCVCNNAQDKKNLIKVICLAGLSVKGIQGCEGYGMQISHHSQFYQKTRFYFASKLQQEQWLKHLEIYQRDSLHKNYQVQQVIGTGNFSVVSRCIYKKDNKVYALKAMEIEKLTENARTAIKNESQIMRVVNHQNIVKYKETILTKTHIYIIAEYIKGEDLSEYVKKRKYLSQYQSAFIIGQIIQAIIYLHGLQILHRDLKPENIMISAKNNNNSPKNTKIQKIKIIDFGFSNYISALEQLPKQKKICGTPNYIAPQLLTEEQPFSGKIDTFSIGSILYFLLSGKLPFLGRNDIETLERSILGKYDLVSQHWKNISIEAKDLIKRLLEVNPRRRIDLEQAVNHQWFCTASKSGGDSSQRLKNVQLINDQNINIVQFSMEPKQEYQANKFQNITTKQK